MGIRTNTNTKDHLRQEGSAPILAVVEDVSTQYPSGDPLRFFTSHSTKPCAVDLNVFRSGQQIRPQRGGSWVGPFTGRPELIAQLAPAIRDQLAPLAIKSVEQYMVSLRAWWRLFDSIEESGGAVLNSVAELNDAFRQRALDQGMRRNEFGHFLLLVNTTRAALGLRPLYWQSPEGKEGSRHLPPRWQTDMVRRELKHRWFAVIDRWALADELRVRGAPLVDRSTNPDAYSEQERLLRNYRRFDEVVAATSNLRPQLESLREKDAYDALFYKQGLSVREMLGGSYPDNGDVRAAFHLCLATTGWNPAVLLSLDVNQDFIEPHPKDPARYILRGTKARAGGAEQLNEGLFKSQGSAGSVIQALMARTAPLRTALEDELRDCREQLTEVLASGDATSNLEAMRARVSMLEAGARSPWLFLGSKKSSIQWLSDDNFSSMPDGAYATYLGNVINAINLRQPEDRQLSRLKPSDLRDAYAAYVYQGSGGSVLSVMRALGHRSVRSTQKYLHNTLLREEHRKLFGTFSAALWREMEANGRVDPTILAQWSRSGAVSPDQRERLHSYRSIMLSRIGVGCLDPMNPPRHIDPNFKPDGKALCHVQRCTLCLENAVLLPQSLPGLCKRLSELRSLRSQIDFAAFQESSFLEEMENLELALMAFDAVEVRQLVEQWDSLIDSGAHRVIHSDGIAREATL